MRVPKSKQDVKVTAIREEEDLTRMTLDELVGKLKTYEIKKDKVNKDETYSKKTQALKASDNDKDIELYQK